MVNGVQQ